MPCVFVGGSAERPGDRTVYQLVLPRREETTREWVWDELDVRPSAIHGLGVYPRPCSAVDWSDLRMPLLLPYLGVESVVEDAHLHRCLLDVLHGDFITVTVGELRERHGGMYTRNGICAVGTSAHKALGGALLADDEKLLQIIDHRSASGGGESACYLLEADARELLRLQASAGGAQPAARGTSAQPVHADAGNSHLFDLLAAHQRLHHSDRHLATHVATIHRDEGFVIVNAHPALGDGLNLVGIINEPTAKERSTLKLVHRSVELLADECAELLKLGVRQPPDAEAVWRAAVIAHDVSCTEEGAWRHAERMVVYLTLRRAYDSARELTVDYGRSYRREYASGEHKPHAHLAAAARSTPRRPDEFARGCADVWPSSLCGWWNPHKQPIERPAFRATRSGRVVLLDDDASLVGARKALAACSGARSTAEGTEGGDGGAKVAVRRRIPPPVPRCHTLSRAAARQRESIAAANAAAGLVAAQLDDAVVPLTQESASGEETKARPVAEAATMTSFFPAGKKRPAELPLGRSGVKKMQG